MKLSGINFQSWSAFDLEIEGFTCIVGPSNLGKSSIYRALYGAVRNDLPESSIKWGTKKMELTLENGPVIATVSRTEKASPIYKIDKEEYRKLGGGIPPEIQTMHLGKIQIGDFSIDATFADQFDVGFGLFWTPQQVNQVLGAFASTDRLEVGKREVNRRVTQVNSEATVVANECATLEASLVSLRILSQEAQEASRAVGVCWSAVESLQGTQSQLDLSLKGWDELATLREVLWMAPKVNVPPGVLDILAPLEEASTLAKELEGYRGMSLSPILPPEVSFALPQALTQALTAQRELVPYRGLDLTPISPPDMKEVGAVPLLRALLVERPPLAVQKIPPQDLTPLLDLADLISSILDIRKDLNNTRISLNACDDELQPIQEELEKVKAELDALDEIECPECHHRWRPHEPSHP